MKFHLLISSLFVLTVIPRMDSKAAKLVPFNEEGSDNFNSVLAQDEFRPHPPPSGKRSADINFNTDDYYDRIPPPGKRSAGINFNTGDDYDRVHSPLGKRSAGINFKTVED